MVGGQPGLTESKTMWLIDQIAERHILQAMERGEFDDLPGTGRPLALEDDRLIPEHLRAGYRLLKNAGYLPPDVQALREVRDSEVAERRARAACDLGAPDTLRPQRHPDVVLDAAREGQRALEHHGDAARVATHDAAALGLEQGGEGT